MSSGTFKQNEQRIAVLGKKYADTATGYSGVATSRTVHLGGSPMVRLEKLDDNGEITSEMFEEGRLEEVYTGEEEEVA